MTKLTLMALLGAVTYAAPEAERVDSLPDIGDFKSGLYSGYVTIPGTQKEIHYLLAQS